MPPESQQDQQKKRTGRPRKFEDAFRQAALERLKTSKDISGLVRELQVSRAQVYRWRDEALGRIPVPNPKTAAQIEEKKDERQQRRIAELERLTARQALELDFFKGALLRIEESRRKREQTSGTPSTTKSRQVDGQQGELTIERMCTLAAVSRASYYRYCETKTNADEEESRLRDAIQRAALESRQYGYRRITRALRAQGWGVNHKRVARLMREDNLLAIRKRRFVPQTTNSEHDFDVAVNVARRLTPTAANQLWVADMTYVRLGVVDVFVAVVMDGFSRKIVGWNLGPKLTTELTHLTRL